MEIKMPENTKTFFAQLNPGDLFIFEDCKEFGLCMKINAWEGHCVQMSSGNIKCGDSQNEVILYDGTLTVTRK